MEKREILAKVDHTLLKQEAGWQQIQEICDDAMAYGTASVCIPPGYVKAVKEYVGERMKVCTVIGFPNGYNTPAVKEYETRDAIENGADEIDMVINIGYVKDGKYDAIEEEIRSLKRICGDRVLKVIIETCLLTDAEKERMCGIVTSAGADYIKTSTGFSTSGATFEDVALFAKYVGSDVKIKAAGGISSFEDAERFAELGADRLGTSRLVNLMKDSAQGDVAPSFGQVFGQTSGQMPGDLPRERLAKQIGYALEARKKSYSPYSHFQVGAALIAEDDTVYTGCNIENVGYSPTNCAERTAFFKAVSEGRTQFKYIIIVGGAQSAGDRIEEFCPPCGVCLQVMMEFCDPEQFRVVLAKNPEEYEIYLLKELLPKGFAPAALERSDSDADV